MKQIYFKKIHEWSATYHKYLFHKRRKIYHNTFYNQTSVILHFNETNVADKTARNFKNHSTLDPKLTFFCRIITGCLSSTLIRLQHLEAFLPSSRVSLTHQSLSSNVL